MKVKILENKIKYFINKRKMSQKDIEICSKIITEYSKYVQTDSQINKFNIYSAKLLFKADRLDDSKRYLKYVDDTNASKNYLCFKIYLREGSYTSAYENLKLYEKNSKNKNKNINLSIYYYLFSILNGSKRENIILNDYFNTCKMPSDQNNLCNVFVDYLLNENYCEALNILNEMQEYVEQNNVPLDFEELRILINKIILKKRLVNNRKNVYELLCEAFSLANNGMYSKSLDKLQEVRNHLNYKKVSYDYKLIKRYIKEKLKIIEIYNSDKSMLYDEIKRMGMLNSYYNDNYIACQYYLYGIYEFNTPEFYYKVGKYYFSIGEQRKAVKYFIEYINKGGFDYLSEVYQYLSKCKAIFNAKQRKKFIEENDRIRNIIKKLSGKNIKNINKSLIVGNYEYDEIKSVIADFNLYPTNKKIEDIRALYENGYIELAETLYNEFNDIISGDGHYQSERRSLECDRLFYINQQKQLIL